MTGGRAAATPRRDVAVVVAGTLLLTAPFVTKPFHIDDDIYLKGAEQILAHPLSPLGGEQKMLGEVMPTHHFTQHPPLVSYFIALVGWAGGGFGETRLHLAFLVFPVLAGLALYSLARRFCRHALTATLLLVATPAFVVTAHGLMTDLPFLAFSLAAAATFVKGVDGGGSRLPALSGLWLGAACLTQYRGLLLLPLLLLYAWIQRSRLAASVPPLLIPVGLVSLFSLFTFLDLGVLHLADAGSWIDLSTTRTLRDALAYVTLLGGATLFPLLVFWLTRPVLARARIWMALLPAMVLLIWRWAPDHVGGQRLLLLLFFITGFAMLFVLLPSPARARELVAVALRRGGEAEARDELFLMLMALVPLASQVILNLFASARSLLLGLPFLVLLLVRRASSAGVLEGRWGARILGGGIAVTAAFALALGVADDRYARAERDLAGDLRAHGARLWFSGEWGFRHYMETDGHQYMTADGAGVARGDTLVLPDIPCPARLDPRLVARLFFVESVESRDSFPIKIMSFEAHAGFYSNFHGLLPYSFSPGPLDRVRVFAVGPER
jgi:hypothetical protein